MSISTPPPPPRAEGRRAHGADGLHARAAFGRGAGDPLWRRGVPLRHGAHHLHHGDDGDGRRARDGDARRAALRQGELRAQPPGRRDRPRARPQGDGRHAHGRARRGRRARDDGARHAARDDEGPGRQRGRRRRGGEAGGDLHGRRLPPPRERRPRGAGRRGLAAHDAPPADDRRRARNREGEANHCFELHVWPPCFYRSSTVYHKTFILGKS